MGDFKKMNKAYEASQQIIEGKMKKERREDYEILKNLKEDDIIIVRGTYDKIEQVFDILKIPYKLIDSYDLNRIDLLPTQTLIINCPGDGFLPEDLRKIKFFVEKGGFLFTTDWVLLNVLQKIFPEYVQFNGIKTRDDVVKVEVVDKSSEYLQGLFDSKDADPQWWLETSSYPIKIMDQDKVKILIQSREMKEKYGDAPIVITFDYGEGTVFHLTSHYYLQRTELRTRRHKNSSKEFAIKEMGLSETDLKDASQFEDLTVGEVESAYTSAQFMVNAMVQRKKKLQQNKKKNNDESIKESLLKSKDV